jgi:hypothetical protein
MNRIVVAFRAFWSALVNRAKAERIAAALEGAPLPKIDRVEKPPPEPAAPAPPPKPARSEALTLLAALQREARLVDLVKQPLTGFSDEEIGGAARNVLSDCGAVLDRFFALQPLVAVEEGATCDVPKGYDPARFKLTGQVAGSGPFQGQLVHHGWRATTVQLPSWTGSKEAALVVAPAEVEVQAESSPSPSSSPQP